MPKTWADIKIFKYPKKINDLLIDLEKIKKEYESEENKLEKELFLKFEDLSFKPNYKPNYLSFESDDKLPIIKGYVLQYVQSCLTKQKEYQKKLEDISTIIATLTKDETYSILKQDGELITNFKAELIELEEKQKKLVKEQTELSNKYLINWSASLQKQKANKKNEINDYDAKILDLNSKIKDEEGRINFYSDTTEKIKQTRLELKQLEEELSNHKIRRKNGFQADDIENYDAKKFIQINVIVLSDIKNIDEAINNMTALIYALKRNLGFLVAEQIKIEKYEKKLKLVENLEIEEINDKTNKLETINLKKYFFNKIEDFKNYQREDVNAKKLTTDDKGKEKVEELGITPLQWFAKEQFHKYQALTEAELNDMIKNQFNIDNIREDLKSLNIIWEGIRNEQKKIKGLKGFKNFTKNRKGKIVTKNGYTDLKLSNVDNLKLQYLIVAQARLNHMGKITALADKDQHINGLKTLLLNEQEEKQISWRTFFLKKVLNKTLKVPFYFKKIFYGSFHKKDEVIESVFNHLEKIEEKIAKAKDETITLFFEARKSDTFFLPGTWTRNNDKRDIKRFYFERFQKTLLKIKKETHVRILDDLNPYAEKTDQWVRKFNTQQGANKGLSVKKIIDIKGDKDINDDLLRQLNNVRVQPLSNDAIDVINASEISVNSLVALQLRP